jgi:glycerol-3-phosphate acyltransferase PlsY
VIDVLGDVGLWPRLALVAVSAFLLGSFPTSFLIGKYLFGRDPRDAGSGATGATNTVRSLGAKAGLATALIDIFKAWLAASLVKWMLVPEAIFDASTMRWAVMVALIAVIAGHAFSPWIKFKGGKCVAVAAGVTMAMWPPLFFIELSIIVVVALFTRYVSVGSIIAAGALPLWIAIFPPTRHIEWIIGGAIAGIFVIVLHGQNIKRLYAGNENAIPLDKVIDKIKGKKAA